MLPSSLFNVGGVVKLVENGDLLGSVLALYELVLETWINVGTPYGTCQ